MSPPVTARGRQAAVALAALAALAAAPSRSSAEPLADIARALVEAELPPELAVTELHLSARLAALDVEPSTVTVTWPRAPRAGTASINLAWGKRQSRFVPVTLATLVTVSVATRDLAPGEAIGPGDVRVEDRPLSAGLAPATDPVGHTARTAIAAGDVIGARAVTRPQPLPRGTAVTVVVVRGAIRATRTGSLERAARPGEPALVRVAADRPALRGTLVGSDTVVIGDVRP